MRIREDFTIGHPADAVWSFLADPDRGARCVPGLEGGHLVLRVGDDSLGLAGSADTQTDDEARRLRIDLRGTDASGQGRARAKLAVTVEDGGLFSTVHLDADVLLSGSLAELGRTGLVAEAVYTMVDEFAECVERTLGSGRRRSFVPAEPDASPASADDTDSWLRRVIRRVRGA